MIYYSIILFLTIMCTSIPTYCMLVPATSAQDKNSTSAALDHPNVTIRRHKKQPVAKKTNSAHITVRHKRSSERPTTPKKTPVKTMSRNKRVGTPFKLNPETAKVPSHYATLVAEAINNGDYQTALYGLQRTDHWCPKIILDEILNNPRKARAIFTTNEIPSNINQEHFRNCIILALQQRMAEKNQNSLLK